MQIVVGVHTVVLKGVYDMEMGEIEYVVIHRSRSTSEIFCPHHFRPKETEVSMLSLPYHLSKV